MIRVLLLSPLPPPAGGIATFTEQLLASGLPKDVAWTHINCAVTGKRRGSPSKRNLWEEGKRARSIYKAMKRVLQANRADLIHLNTALTVGGMLRDCILVRLARRWNVPVVLHCHRHLPDAVHGWLAAMLVRHICHLSTAVLCLNRPSQEFLNAFAGIQARILPNFLHRLPEVCKREPAGRIRKAVYVGDISAEKGCDTLLKAAKQLPSIAFWMIGSVKQKKLCQQAPANVVLTGPLERADVYRELQRADVFVFASRSEGFPYAVLEAMAAGLPIVSSRVGAVPEMLSGAGVLFDAGDVQGLIRAMESLQDETQRYRLGQLCLKRARTCYTEQAVLEQLGLYYRTVWEKRRGKPDC